MSANELRIVLIVIALGIVVVLINAGFILNFSTPYPAISQQVY